MDKSVCYIKKEKTKIKKSSFHKQESIMRIGIMGGTFDPIHNGHLMLGRAALTQYALDEVWFMPNGNPPHKGNITAPIEARCKMTELAIEGTKKFRLELYEADDKSVSYSYKTLEHFYKNQKIR